MPPQMSADEMIGAVTGLQAKIATLATERDADRAKLARMVEERTELTQRLTAVEQAARSAQAEARTDGPEREIVSRFVERDSGKIRWYAKDVEREQDAEDYGILDSPETYGDWHRDLKRAVTARNVVRAALMAPHVRAGRQVTRSLTPKLDRKVDRIVKSGPAAVRKAFVDASSEGAAFISDPKLPWVDDQTPYMRSVEALFPRVNVTSRVITLPAVTAGMTPYIAGQVTSDAPAAFQASSLADTERTLTVKKLAVRTVYDADAAEDAFIPIVQSLLLPQIAKALAKGTEDAVINGDTGTHQDTDLANWNPDSEWSASLLGSSIDHRRSWIGLRAHSADASNTTDQSSVNTYAGFRTACGKLRGQTDPTDIVSIMSNGYAWDTVGGFAEVKTRDVFGDDASVVKGTVMMLAGVPLVVSQFMTEDLQATGLFTTTGGTKTGFLVVRRSGFAFLDRRATTIEAVYDATTQTYNLVVTRRVLFTPVHGTTVKDAHFSYNM